jgi:4-amino-4-deoxy-L-arabinose transferase-like glycosyltransferase
MLAGLLTLSALLNGYHLWWGLPNGNETWAGDALQPLTPLAIVYESFRRGWSSGWFFFKYPIGHALLLACLYVPYLGCLWLLGRFSPAGPQYPYGFSDPETALFVLAMIGRVVTFVMATATVWLLYRVGKGLFGRSVGLWAAFGAATSPLFVYYAHTTNLDVPSVFWMALAWFAAVETVRTGSPRMLLLFGAASGVTLATKEQPLGFLVGLSAVLAVAIGRRCWSGEEKPVRSLKRLALAAGSGAVLLLLLNNAFYNPLGFYHRLQFLSGNLPADVQALYVPRVPHIRVGESFGWTTHLSILLDAVRQAAWALGFPWFALCVCGVAVALVRSFWTALQVLVPMIGYYLLSITVLPGVAARYVLPLSIALPIFGGVMCVHLWSFGRAAKAVVVATAVLTTIHGAGMVYLLANDPRYDAEEWLARRTPAGTVVETYHKDTFLPRLPEWVKLVRPDFEEISIADLARRNPDLILTTGSDVHNISTRNPSSGTESIRRRENILFARALFAGELGYHPVAKFQRWWPFLPDGYVRSVNPAIWIFARDDWRPASGS